MKIRKSLVYSVLLGFALSLGVAFADIDSSDIYIGADQTKLLRLSEDAASVIVANPAYANVVADTPRHLVIMPRQPGATTFTVLGQNGNIIMERKVVVGADQDRYVKIRRACSNAGDSECAATSVYYCPDGCHEVYVASAAQANNNGSASTQSLTENSGSVPMIPAPSEQ